MNEAAQGGAPCISPIVPESHLGPLTLVPWFADGAMSAFFLKHRMQLPVSLIPDGKPHAFSNGGLQYFYLADVDEDGPHVAAYFQRVPLPFPVGLRYQARGRHYQVQCAECARRWWADNADKYII